MTLALLCPTHGSGKQRRQSLILEENSVLYLFLTCSTSSSYLPHHELLYGGIYAARNL